LTPLALRTDPIAGWRSIPKSETAIKTNWSDIPENSYDMRTWAADQLAKLPQRVVSPWGDEVVLHKGHDIRSRATHYVTGGAGMSPSWKRAYTLPMLAHTVHNAMIYATTGSPSLGAYLYRYAGGDLHIVLVNTARRDINHQFVVTQYPHDPNHRTVSDLLVNLRNGLDKK
jgi:hypothetical protein